jgi:hypothetical protein
MSDKDIFSGSDQSTNETNKTDVNNGTSGDPTTGPLAVLVGEGRKYRTVEDLAKAYMSADDFIERIKGENASLREQLGKAKTIDEVLERLKAEPSAASQDKDDKPTPSGLSVQDVRQIVSDTLTGVESARAREGNLRKADAEMKKLFGEKAAAVFEKEASTPAMRKALMDLASVSPDKFIALFVPKNNSGTSIETNTSVNTAALSGDMASGRGADPSCKEYYDNLRRKEPAKYYSSAFQLQMNKAAVTDPSRFFGRT